MLVNNTETTCKYFFGQEAEKIFSDFHLTQPRSQGLMTQCQSFRSEGEIDKKRKFIDECLDLLIRVNVFLLSKKEGLFLIDPKDHQNQCHLSSMRAVQIMAVYSQQTEEEKLSKNGENRFLHLSFFLSLSLISDMNLFVKTIQAAMKEMKAKAPAPKNKFQDFLRDQKRSRENAARQALVDDFESHIKSLFASSAESSPLRSELHLMAQEDLQMSSSFDPMISNISLNKEKTFTLPKLAGMAHFVSEIAKKNIPYVIKVKVMTKDGVAGTVVKPFGEIQAKTPVIVFEAIATDGSFSLPVCTEEAKKCHQYFFRHPDRKMRHDEQKKCFNCTFSAIDLQPYRERIEQAAKSPEEMFYAVAADFMAQVQPEALPLFDNREKYPLLSKIYRESIPKVSELGLSRNNPVTFSVCHVHPDNGLHALSETLFLDASPEAILKNRGMI